MTEPNLSEALDGMRRFFTQESLAELEEELTRERSPDPRDQIIAELQAKLAAERQAAIDIAAECLNSGAVKDGTRGTVEAVKQVCAKLAASEAHQASGHAEGLVLVLADALEQACNGWEGTRVFGGLQPENEEIEQYRELARNAKGGVK